MGAARSPIIPDVPTVRELGVKDVDGASTTAMLAPKGTPQPIIERMNAEVAKILALPELKEKADASASVAASMSPADMASKLKRDTAAFKEIIEKAKITAD